MTKISRDGYSFNQNDTIWVLNKDIKIKLTRDILSLDNSLLDGFKNILSDYAQEMSAHHTRNMLFMFRQLIKYSNGNAITTDSILNWRASLTRENEWYLGSLKGFLRTWYKRGYLGISLEVVKLLETFNIKGNKKGKSVANHCPYTGPMTNNELLSLVSELNELWKQSRISFECYAYINALIITARRPSQLKQLKMCDLIKDNNDYYINIPRVKQRHSNFRKSFRKFAVTEDLYLIIRNLAEDQIKKIETHISNTLPFEQRKLTPIFMSHQTLLEINKGNVGLYLEKDLLHSTIQEMKKLMVEFNNVQHAISERTGKVIYVNARRFRYTRGTNLGRKGVGATVIAELLDHSDIQNIKVYTENTADTVQYIDRVMGAEMGKLAHAFSGRIISSLNEGERGNDPTSFITNNGSDTVGACSTNKFCISSYESCYLCRKFRPLLDGPHQQILDKLYREKEERLRVSKSIDYANSKDRIILAVEYVVKACNQMKKSREIH